MRRNQLRWLSNLLDLTTLYHGYIFPAKENEVELYANDANASRVSAHKFAQAIKRRSDPFGTSCLNL